MLVDILALLFACQFTLGFASLQAQIPSVVGDCVSDTTYAADGDALQLTTHGLLVWRKADNWTAFTDGADTWVNGPLGVEERPNTSRFWWEVNPEQLPMVPPPRPGDRCHTAALALSLLTVDAGAGNLVGTFQLTNTSPVECTFLGYPGAQLLDSLGNPLQTNVVWGGGYFSGDPPPSLVTLADSASAIFRVHWEQVPVGNEATCPEASALAVTPPDEYVALPVEVQIRACGGGTLNVSRVQSS